MVTVAAFTKLLGSAAAAVATKLEPDLAMFDTATLWVLATEAESVPTVLGVDVLRLVMATVVAPLLSDDTLTGEAAFVRVDNVLRSVSAVMALLWNPVSGDTLRVPRASAAESMAVLAVLNGVADSELFSTQFGILPPVVQV